MTPTSKSLICEGACNPDLPSLDRQVGALGLGSESPKSLPPDEAGKLISDLRGLKHLPHVEVRSSIYACTQCGQPRRF